MRTLLSLTILLAFLNLFQAATTGTLTISFYINIIVLTLSAYTASPNSIGSSSQLSFSVLGQSGSSYSVPAGAIFVFTFPTSFTNTNPTCSASVSLDQGTTGLNMYRLT